MDASLCGDHRKATSNAVVAVSALQMRLLTFWIGRKETLCILIFMASRSCAVFSTFFEYRTWKPSKISQIVWPLDFVEPLLPPQWSFNWPDGHSVKPMHKNIMLEIFHTCDVFDLYSENRDRMQGQTRSLYLNTHIKCSILCTIVGNTFIYIFVLNITFLWWNFYQLKNYQ